MKFTEESNALDYLERAASCIRETDVDDKAWKWVIIALHGALYGFAICACKGTDYQRVLVDTKKGKAWKLISFSAALKACEDPHSMRMTVNSKPLVLTDEQRAAIAKLQHELRNSFEHYIPKRWSIEMHDLPTIAIHCIEVIRFLALETNNYTMLSRAEATRIDSLASTSIKFLRATHLHAEYTSRKAA